MIKQIKRFFIVSLVIIMILLAGPASAQTACTPSGTNPETGEAFDQCVAYTFTGTEQTFTVPDDVEGDSLQLKVWGAGGGGGLFLNFGGHGAFGSAIHDAAAGDSYTIIVGEGGLGNDLQDTFGGGGGTNATSVAPPGFGGSGGGFSGIRVSPTDYIILLGGGGGGSPSNDIDGGSGGITTGFDGGLTREGRFSAAFPDCEITSGQGGTQTTGGAAGITTLTGSTATPGTAFQGGRGSVTLPGQNGGNSAGGGGGLFGGGGGVGGVSNVTCDDSAGGGGSSFLSASLTNITTEARVPRVPVNGGGMTDVPGSTDPHFSGISSTPGRGAPGTSFPIPTGMADLLNGSNGLVTIQWTEDPRASLPTFACTGEFFQVHGNGTSDLSRVDLLTGSFSLVGDTGASLRGAGLNAADGLAYGIQDQNPLAGNVLFAVGADGSSVNLGTVTGLPARNYPSGDFGPDGLFYMRENGNNNRLIAIDVNTKTVVREHAPSGITNPTTADFAFNPSDQSFYAVESNQADARLLRFQITDDSTVSVTSVGLTGIQTNGNGGTNVFGAMYADSDGNVFGIQNRTGNLLSLIHI